MLFALSDFSLGLKPTFQVAVGGLAVSLPKFTSADLDRLVGACGQALRVMRKGWSFKDDRRVMELVKASKTLKEIARIMKRTPDRLPRVAMRLGVSVKSQSLKK